MMDLAQRMARVEEALERIEEKIDVALARHERLLYGNNGNPGLLMDLDRIKQEKIRMDRAYKWVAGVLATVVSGLALLQFRH